MMVIEQLEVPIVQAPLAGGPSTVELAVAAAFRLGITQQEVVEELSRALGIVRSVLEYSQSMPRSRLAALGRTFWARLPQWWLTT